MLTPARFRQHCAQLVDRQTSADSRKDLIAEVRDSIEVVHTLEYTTFLSHYLPAFKVVLSELTQPQQVDNNIHKTRAIILEILNRLPHNEVLRTRILEVFTMSMDILKNDNEENAVHAIHIIFDLQKNYRHQLNGQVQPFLDFVRQLYQSFAETVKDILIQRPPTQPGNPAQQRISTSARSFKVITECPLLVMFVFQLYPSLIRTNIQQLLPLMISAIRLEVPAHVIPACPKNAFQEFVAAQVKTVSFLAYLLKQFPDLMKSDEVSIPRSVVKLMQTCPGDAVATRKELLVATRHILTSSYRKGFFDQVDLLLDERVLVGTGRAATDTLRPLAYFFLAELVHCVRLSLTVPQLEKIIFLFSTNVHDPKFSYTLQDSSVRLLLNLMEGILKVSPEDASLRAAARQLLIRILETMVEKYITLGDQVERLLKVVEDMRSKPDPVTSGKRLGEVPVGDPLKEVADFKTLLKTLTLGLKTVIWSAIKIRVPSGSSTRSQAQLNAPANTANKASLTQPSGIQGRASIRTGLLERECEIVSSLIAAGKRCFRLYSRHEKANGGGVSLKTSRSRKDATEDEDKRRSGKQGRDSESPFDITRGFDPSKIVAATSQEEKEVFDQFAQIFTVLDPPSFQDVFGLRISDLFEYIVENPASMTIAQHFLANSSVSKYFADLLFNFVVDNMSLLDVPLQQPGEKASKESRRATSLLKLFNILFASVTLFSANEPVLRLHLPTIVRSCLNHAAKAADPHAYLQMLRALFKSATSGKAEVQYEMLYRDFMPLVDPLFAGLLALYRGPSKILHKELIIELCLMIPARPSTIFPHLEQQIKPIVWALEGGRDNPTYGLRTLEFWVGMLQPSYLDMLLSKVEPGLTKALHRHLKPPGNPHGPTALRILGKLGSRSRTIKNLTIPLKYDVEYEAVQQLFMDWRDGIEIPMETDRLIGLAADTLLGRRQMKGKPSLDHRLQAWKFLFGCLCPFLGWDREVDIDMRDSGSKEGSETQWSLSVPNTVPTIVQDRNLDGTSRKKRTRYVSEAELSLVSTLLSALIGSLAKVEFRTAKMDFGKSGNKTPEFCLQGLCKYFAMLAVQESMSRLHNARKGDSGRTDHGEGEQGTVLNYKVFLEALIDVLSSEDRDQASAGLGCLNQYISAIRSYCKVTSVSSGSEKNKGLAKETESLLQTKNSPGTPAAPAKQEAGVVASAGNAMDIEKKELSSDAKGTAKGGDERAGNNRGSEDHAMSSNLQLFSYAVTPVIERLCHCCHQRTWNAKWAGVNGFEAVFNSIATEGYISPFSTTAHFSILRALLFLTRDSVDSGSERAVKKTKVLLCKILKLMFDRNKALESSGKASGIPQSKLVQEVCNRLTKELVCESSNARETARYCFAVLAETVGLEVTDLVQTTKEAVLRLVGQRPLRQHSLTVQIGYLEAINYCMELKKPLVAPNLFVSPLRDNILVECMYTLEGNSSDPSADSEEGLRQRFQENKYFDSNTARQLITLKRRVLQLLCNISIHCAKQLQETNSERLFRGLITCLFRSLQSKDNEILESAKMGLKQAISKHPKPKELLQLNLRPILVYLGDYKKLTIPYLQGLSRVLGLFSHWFNVSLGEKLLEHLQRWTEPEKIAALKKTMPGTESRIAAAILDLFYLLPAVASKFLDQIFHMVIRLESVLALAAPGAAHLGIKSTSSASTSPYRAPLLKYCNRHVEVASKFLLAKLEDERIRQLFFVMIRSPESEPLRGDLMDSPKRLLAPSYFSGDGSSGKALHIISLIDLLSRHRPEWLASDPEIIAKLTTYWKIASDASGLRQHNSVSLCRIREVRTVAEIFIRYCTQFPKEINVLFELLPVFAVRTICDFTFVKEFLQRTVTGGNVYPDKKAMLLKFLSMFHTKTYPQERKVHALQFIIIPMIRHHLERRSKDRKISAGLAALDAKGVSDSSKVQGAEASGGTQNNSDLRSSRSDGDQKEESRAQMKSDPPKTQDEIMDTALIHMLVKELLDQSEEVIRSYDEPLTAQLLHLATVLIQYMPKELNRYRKELIKFGWNNLKREDSICKYWAFVNVSRFFEAYHAPVKIILQVYVALLRACEPDGRELVHQALDILTPALPRRLVHNPSDHKHPIWIRYTKKILLEEGHNVPNLMHIYQLFLRNSDLFYVSRGQFIPIMVGSLSRIGLSAATATENRRLALDIVDLILKWETTRRELVAKQGLPATGKLGDGSVKKRPRDDVPVNNPVQDGEPGKKNAPAAGRASGMKPPAKTMKTNDGQAVPVSASPTRSSPSPGLRDTEDYKPTPNMVDVMINFVVQIPFRPMHRREAPIISARCVSLLGKALRLWPEASVKLGFLEKFIAPLPQPQEKTGLRGPSASGNKSTSNASGGDGQHDVKKADAQKNDKAEQARMKREVMRQTSLSISLLLTAVLVKNQGSKFIEANMGAIRALVAPSLSEGLPGAATRFSSLIKDILDVCPYPEASPAPPKINVKQTTPEVPRTSGPDGVPSRKMEPSAQKVELVSSAANQRGASAETKKINVWQSGLSSEIKTAIDNCLKSTKTSHCYCGMMALKSLTAGAPREFVKYQEVLTKILHRMTKENLNGSNSGSGGASSSQGTGMGLTSHRSRDWAASHTGSQGRGTALSTDQPSDSVQNDSSKAPKGGAEKTTSHNREDVQALVLCISLLGENISTLEMSQRKSLFHLLWALIEKCVQVEVLLEVVRIVGNWVFSKPHPRVAATSNVKESLTTKEKVHFLSKMVIFERISGAGSRELMDAYLKIILRIFGGLDIHDKRPELVPKLEKAFMLGLKTTESPLRAQFFKIFDASVDYSLAVRLNYIIAKQEWEHIASTMWIKPAAELLLSAVNDAGSLRANVDRARFAPPLETPPNSSFVKSSDAVANESQNKDYICDPDLGLFKAFLQSVHQKPFTLSLMKLLLEDSEIALETWLNIFPKAWSKLGIAERKNMERSMAILLGKEYHQLQMSWNPNSVQALLGAIASCDPLPTLRPELVRHLGCRWNAWHTSLQYLDRREQDLRNQLAVKSNVQDERATNQISAELEDIANAQSSIFSALNERDYRAGLWKFRSSNPLTAKALSMEQLGLHRNAQEFYADALAADFDLSSEPAGKPGIAEFSFWEERWIDCARALCQWEMLTEFSRTVVHSKLLHECLWKLPDWSALKQLLLRNPIPDGPQLKLYQAYVQVQENKLEIAENFINKGYQKAQEKFCSLPETADMDTIAPVLLQFQQLVELQESSKILAELNALSRHGNGSVNVVEKVNNVRDILNTWRERVPSPHEPLVFWNDVLTWRNHVHGVVVNVLEALKEAANAKVAAAQTAGGSGVNGNRGAGGNAQAAQVQAAASIAQALPQHVLVMGVNETAWNVHRFAKACRKQGYPDVALYGLERLYPFGTMELAEYFIKTKEKARAFMAGPPGLEKHVENGLHELSRCNMDHFNERQKAQLFTLKGKLYAALGKEEEAVEAFCTALHTSADVGSAWLAWGKHCDKMQGRASANPESFANFSDDTMVKPQSPELLPRGYAAELAFREAAVKCFIQGARFGSRKARLHLPRVLRLLSTDITSRNFFIARRKALSVGNDTNNVGGSQKPKQTANGNMATVAAASKSASLNFAGVSDSALEAKLFGKSVSKTYAGLLLEIPSWMWLPWLPQIVPMLSRREAEVMRPVLMRIAQQYPQAAFFYLRSFMEERKHLDKPHRQQHKEAVKLGRPIAPALRSTATPAHLAGITKQVQSAKENVNRANQRYMALRNEVEKIDKKLAPTEGTAEHGHLLARKEQLTNESANTRRLLEKCIQVFHAAAQRQRQIQESLPGLAIPIKNSSSGGQASSDGAEKSGGSASSKRPGGEGGKLSGSSKSADGKSSGSEKGGIGSQQRGTSQKGGSTPYEIADLVMTQMVKTHQIVYIDMEKITSELATGLKPQREENLLSLMNVLLHKCYHTSMKSRKEVLPTFRGALEEVSRRCFGTGVQTREGHPSVIVPASIADLKGKFEAEMAPQVAADFPKDWDTFITRLTRWQRIFQRRVESLPQHIRLQNLSRQLMEVRNSDVEVFGQYCGVEPSEPASDRHVKIGCFSADVRILTRPSGHSRGLRVIGSDGKHYEFVLETSVHSNVQSSEERTGQIYRLLNAYMFDKDSEARRRRVNLSVPIMMGIGGRARLVSDDLNVTCIGGGLERYLEEMGRDRDDLIMKFSKLVNKNEGERKSQVITARVDAYKELCETDIPDDCLCNWISRKMRNASNYFAFRKRFSETLGTSSTVAYVLGVKARRMNNFMFSWETGAIYNQHGRMLLSSNQGIVESDEAVPFRLTRNIERLVGRFGMQGSLFGSMGCSLKTLREYQELLRVVLEFVVRDEVTGWVSAKVEGARNKTEVEWMGKAEFDMVEDSLSRSIAGMERRIQGVENKKEDEMQDDGEEVEVVESCERLIKRATDVRNLAQMEPTWQAWY